MKTPLRVFAAIFLALFAVSSIALIGGGIIQHNHSSAASGGNTLAPGTISGGTITTSGTISSTKACAAGYTRITPNFCLIQAPGGDISVLTCTAIPSPDPGATALYLRLQVVILDQSSVAGTNHSLDVRAHRVTACAGTHHQQIFSAVNEVAGTGITLLRTSKTLIAPVVVADAGALVTTIETVCATCTAGVAIQGYFD